MTNPSSHPKSVSLVSEKKSREGRISTGGQQWTEGAPINLTSRTAMGRGTFGGRRDRTLLRSVTDPSGETRWKRSDLNSEYYWV